MQGPDGRGGARGEGGESHDHSTTVFPSFCLAFHEHHTVNIRQHREKGLMDKMRIALERDIMYYTLREGRGAGGGVVLQQFNLEKIVLQYLSCIGIHIYIDVYIYIYNISLFRTVFFSAGSYLCEKLPAPEGSRPIPPRSCTRVDSKRSSAEPS